MNNNDIDWNSEISLPRYPDHVMRFRQSNETLRVALKPKTIAENENTSPSVLLTGKPILLLEETYRSHTLEPVYYFHRDTLLITEFDESEGIYLKENFKSTYCALKGHTVYFDAFSKNTLRTENIAWSYTTITNPDEKAAAIKDLMAFDAGLVNIDVV